MRRRSDLKPNSRMLFRKEYQILWAYVQKRFKSIVSSTKEHTRSNGGTLRPTEITLPKEHTRIRTIAAAGYEPIRLMYYYPNRAQAMRIQAAIEDLYLANGGAYYCGDAAWEHLKTVTNIDLQAILEEIAVENT